MIDYVKKENFNNYKYIDKSTYEIYDYPKENTFECDSLIAPTISLLNKKGYHTLAACQGHDIKKEDYSEDVEMSKERYEFIKDDKHIQLLGKTEKDDLSLKVRIYNKGYGTYILFDKRYDIDIPKGFNKSYIKNKMAIRHEITTVKEIDGKIVRMTNKEVHDEIKEINMNLYEKVLDYKDINEEKKSYTHNL